MVISSSAEPTPLSYFIKSFGQSFDVRSEHEVGMTVLPIRQMTFLKGKICFREYVLMEFKVCFLLFFFALYDDSLFTLSEFMTTQFCTSV
jgi:hypothetical protein